MGGYLTAVGMCCMIIMCYTASAEESVILKAMWAPKILTGLWFLVLAGLIALMHLARRQTGEDKLRLIRYAGFVAIGLILVRFFDMNSRDFSTFSTYKTLVVSSALPIWLLLVGYRKCCCCCGTKPGCCC